jgi:flavin-dependent dehydrogenase
MARYKTSRIEASAPHPLAWEDAMSQWAAVDDYVIVGAGSAGCVLAARLSEDPDVEVALVEAGPPDTAQEIHIPVAFAQLFQTKWDWDYQGESRILDSLECVCAGQAGSEYPATSVPFSISPTPNPGWMAAAATSLGARCSAAPRP